MLTVADLIIVADYFPYSSKYPKSEEKYAGWRMDIQSGSSEKYEFIS
jgi:hypothetical protein